MVQYFSIEIERLVGCMLYHTMGHGYPMINTHRVVFFFSVAAGIPYIVPRDILSVEL